MKAKKKNNKKSLLYNGLIILLSCVLLFCVVQLIPDDSVSTTQGDESDYHRVEWKNKSYKYNASITNILFLGIDESSDQGNADTIELVELCSDTKSIKLISIPRNTITDVKVYDSKNVLVGWGSTYLALSYYYGKDSKHGCLLASEAVSRMFNNVPVNYYGALQLDQLKDFHNIVGDLKVTVPDDSLVDSNPEWFEGNEVTITSDNVEAFVRSRDINVMFSNTTRMERQKVYLKAYFEKLKELLGQDFDGTISKIMDVLDETTTNISLEKMESFAEKIMTYSFDSDSIVKLPGENVAGATRSRYEIDKDTIMDFTIEMFYKEG